MTAEHVDFDAQPPQAGEPALTFTLAAEKWTCRSKDDVPLWLFSGISEVRYDEFFRAVLADGEYERFEEKVLAKGSPVSRAQLQNVVPVITEKVLGFPTTSPASSKRGSRATSRKSAAGSSRRATPQRRSA